jgi:hypothetical protein
MRAYLISVIIIQFLCSSCILAMYCLQEGQRKDAEIKCNVPTCIDTTSNLLSLLSLLFYGVKKKGEEERNVTTLWLIIHCIKPRQGYCISRTDMYCEIFHCYFTWCDCRFLAALYCRIYSDRINQMKQNEPRHLRCEMTICYILL